VSKIGKFLILDLFEEKIDVKDNFELRILLPPNVKYLPVLQSACNPYKAYKVYKIHSGIAAANPGLQKLIMGLVFPVCLLLVQLCGADLYTGNTAFVSAIISTLIIP
jgi:hypothetical protein